MAWPNATRSALARVVVSRSLAALAGGLPASWRRPLGRAWRWMSGSLGRASARLVRLLWPPRVLRGEHRRVWSRATLLELGCGWERGHVLIPIRNQRTAGCAACCATRRPRACAEDARRARHPARLAAPPCARAVGVGRARRGAA